MMTDRSVSILQPNRIQKLSPLLINQLAAGEVVTRPASVVKELLENAIDSEADRIDIRITQGGMGMIEVTDNGQGILADDMPMAVTRHATSKVADVANLQGIHTLGFRGEALASIVAVSRVCIISSADDSGVGRKLSVTGVIGDMPDIVPCVCQRGTQVTVKDLYFNVPARRANLKNIATEYQHIENVVKDIATAYPAMTFHLYHDGKCRLQLSAIKPITQLKHKLKKNQLSHLNNQNNVLFTAYLTRLKQILDLSDVSLMPFYRELSPYLPSDTAESSSSYFIGWLWQSGGGQRERLIYVNHRLVKQPAISQQIRQTLTAQNVNIDTISYALYLTLPSSLCNLNVHPSKQTIHIQALSTINGHLHDCLCQLAHSKFISFNKTDLDKAKKNDKQTKNQNHLASRIANQSVVYQKLCHATQNQQIRSNQVNSPHVNYQLSNVAGVFKKSQPVAIHKNTVQLTSIYQINSSVLKQILTAKIWQTIDQALYYQWISPSVLMKLHFLKLPSNNMPWHLLWHEQTLILTQSYDGKHYLIAQLNNEMLLQSMLIQNHGHKL